MTWEEAGTQVQGKLSELSGLSGVTIEVCGVWVWLSGETYPVREQLKSLGFKWARRKQKWHWSPLPPRSQRRSMPMDYIRDKYGSTLIEEEARE